MNLFHRWPYRCRNCQNRFYVYIAPAKDDVEETAEVEEEAGRSKAETAQNPDVAKPAGQ